MVDLKKNTSSIELVLNVLYFEKKKLTAFYRFIAKCNP